MTNQTALLVMDMQKGIAHNVPQINSLIKANQRAIAAAREHHIPVVFMRVALEKNFADVSPNNRVFSSFKQRGINMTENDEFAQIIDELEPDEDEPILTKRRFSAFTGSGLEVFLQANRINHLVLTGISTSGVVLSTALEAADKDFQITVLEDAIGDRSKDKHDFIIEQILTRSCEIESVESWRNHL
ncbi:MULTISPECIES: cysteine hydrolase family protein [Staphylococcus]|uniref:Isochorismatase transposase n=1 Tax=Staphylococcus caprae TaxID=29380 RepID=A0ABM7FMX0_9STAP|nr:MULTISPECIES: isochorismatase family cysteine hydrolase [Staphylococcus]MBN6826489.1 cysteine hydrolase [Staphylococcus caprae]MBX5317474.1 cysteine hydrolase [Staphylococcus caprae]MBX5323314.1 cysteine hydrolase [Staphylococcus caprae]MCI2954873.1 cysteine hydrolase [Staphylococcus caprae]MCR6089765.1 cysteine hydrolase [Staphylococcus aureus]